MTEPRHDRPAEHTAAKDIPTGDASTLSSDVLDLLTAIRDALDVPLPDLGTPDGYEQMRLLTHRRARSVLLAAEVAVKMDGRPSWAVLTEGVRDGIERRPVTYPAWQDPEPTGGDQR